MAVMAPPRMGWWSGMVERVKDYWSFWAACYMRWSGHAARNKRKQPYTLYTVHCTTLNTVHTLLYYTSTLTHTTTQHTHAYTHL